MRYNDLMQWQGHQQPWPHPRWFRDWMDDFHSGGQSERTGFTPSVDFHERENEYEVTAELPGIAREDIDVSIDAGLLTLRGEKREESTSECDGGCKYTERVFGSFSRTIALPHDCDADKAEARFVNGVLEVHLPKKAEAGPQSRRIDVEAA